MQTLATDIGNEDTPLSTSATDLTINSAGYVYLAGSTTEVTSVETSMSAKDFNLSCLGDLTVAFGITSKGSLNLQTTGALTVSGPLQVGDPSQPGGNVDIVNSAGNLQINANINAQSSSDIHVYIQNFDTELGTISIGNNISIFGHSGIGAATTAIVMGEVPSNPVPGTSPGGIVQVGPGAVFWGTSPGIITGGDCTAQVTGLGDVIIFETLGLDFRAY